MSKGIDSIANLLFKISQTFPFYQRGETIYRAHSPTLFSILNAIEKTTLPRALVALHHEIKSDKELLDKTNWGAKKENKIVATASQIYDASASKLWKTRLLLGITSQINNGVLLDLGTNLGLSAIPLALSQPERTIITFEGNKSFVDYAQIQCSKLNIKNIKFVLGDINQTLPKILERLTESISFTFLDANHSKEATVHYLNLIQPKLAEEDHLILFDDIRWSREMFETWQIIQKLESFNLSVDFFQVGLVGAKKGIIQKTNFHYLPKWAKPWQFTL